MALFKEVMPDLQFGHFNILEDEEVRQGIKGFLTFDVELPSLKQIFRVFKLANFSTIVHRG